MSMKKNFFKYMLLGAFTLALGVGFVGCKDYDEDIDDLYAKLQTAQASLTQLQSSIDAKADKSYVDQAKADAIAEAKRLIDEITGTGPELEDLKARLAALEVTVEGFEPEQIAYQKALLELQVAAMEEYKFVNGDGEPDFMAAYKALAEAQAVTKLLDEETMAKLVQLVAQVDPLLNLLPSVEGMITEVKVLVNYSANDDTNGRALLDFAQDEVTSESYVFAPGVEGAITFTKGELIGTAAENYITVKVSPANAVLTAENVFLYSQPALGVNDVVSVTKVEAYTEAITRAVPSSAGLWKVYFAANEGVEVEDLVAATTDEEAGPLAFAIAVQSNISETDRHIVSDFDVVIDAAPAADNWDLNFNVQQTYADGVTVRNRNVTSLPNKYDIVKDSVWIAPVGLAITPSKKDKDDRSTAANILIQAGTDFDVVMNAGKEVYAFYVTLEDANRATSAAYAEWQSMGIEGMNVMSYTQKATLKIPASIAAGKDIGFNVFAVNQNGWIVDPGGRQFWVRTSAAATEPPVVNPVGMVSFELKANAPATFAGGSYNVFPSEAATFDFATTDLNAAEIASIKTAVVSKFLIDPINAGTAAHSTTVGSPTPTPTVVFLDKDKKVISTAGALNAGKTAADVKFLQLAGLVPSDYLTDATVPAAKENAYVEFKNTAATPETVYAAYIQVTKVEPVFPSNFTLKSTAITNGTNLVFRYNGLPSGVLTYPVPLAQVETRDLAGQFNNSTNVSYVATKEATYIDLTAPAAIKPATDLTAFTKTIPVDIKMDFGYFPYFNEAPNNTYAKAWADPAVTAIQMRSSVQLATMATATNWSVWNYSDDIPTGASDPKYTRTWFVFGNEMPSGPTAANYVIDMAAVRIANPATNQPFDLSLANAQTATYTGTPPTYNTVATWGDENIESVRAYLVPQGTDVSKQANLDAGNPYFDVALPTSYGTDAIKLTVTPKEVPGSLVPYKMTLVLKVRDQFGNETNWVSPTDVIQGVEALQPKPVPVP